MTKLSAHRMTIEELRQAGIPIHSGKEYFKHWPKPKRRVSLERVQAILSKIPDSLAEEISRMRNEEG